MNKTWKIIISVIIITIILVGGIYLSQRSNSEDRIQQTIKTDTSTENDNTQEAESTDWVTFNFQEKNISFQHPDDWTIIDLPDPKAGVALRSPKYSTISSGNVDYSGEIYVNTITNSQNLSIQELFDTFNDTSRFWFDNYQYENVSYNGLSGVQFPKIQESGQSYSRTDIYLTCPDKIVSLSYLYEEDKYPDIVNEIAKTVSCSSKN